MATATNSSGTGTAPKHTEHITTVSLLLVMLSALFHATWNLAARQTKGDLAVLVGGISMAGVVLTPVAFLVPVTGPILDAMPYVVASGLIHAVYMILIGEMYAVAGGSVSLVYPVARGTGVAFTAVMALPVLGETVSVLGGFGIAAVVAGISILAWSKLGVLGKCANRDLLGRQRQREQEMTVQGGEAGVSGINVDVAQSKDGNKLPALGLALLCGMIISSYSLVDKIGVGLMNPIQFLWGFVVIEAVIMVPYMFCQRRDQCMLAVRTKKRYMAIVGFGAWGCYLIILYVLTSSPSSYVTPLREVSVAFGAGLGVLILKEDLTVGMLTGVFAIVLGLIMIKVA